MRSDKRSEYITRDSLLKLLSDEEIARVSTAETADRLSEGEEYVDLEHPDRGVHRAKAGSIIRDALPRKAVSETAWRDIVILLDAHERAAMRARTATKN